MNELQEMYLNVGVSIIVVMSFIVAMLLIKTSGSLKTLYKREPYINGLSFIITISGIFLVCSY